MQGQLTRQQLTVLILALMATGMGQSLVFAILAPLGREVHLRELQITSIIALSALIFGLAAPRWGRFSDRIGRKPIIITGLVGYATGTLLFTSVFYAGLTGLLSGALLYGDIAANTLQPIDRHVCHRTRQRGLRRRPHQSRAAHQNHGPPGDSQQHGHHPGSSRERSARDFWAAGSPVFCRRPRRRGRGGGVAKTTAYGRRGASH